MRGRGGMAQGGDRQIRDLKTTGHLMLLESGVYCVFLEPGSVPPAPESGLPAVQIAAGPGPDKAAVSVLSFHNDGWVGADSAAMVRVAGAPAHVMVTVYQDPAAAHEPPRLQVQKVVARVEGGAAAPTAAGPRAARPVEILAHIYGRGDVGGMLGEWVGEPGSNRWIEGFAIAPREGIPAGDIEYQAVLGRGWMSPWAEGSTFCGSRGMSLPILGLRVRLRGDSARTHRVVLMATFVDGTRVGPCGDDEVCEASSMSPLESFDLRFLPREEAQANAPATPPTRAGKPRSAASRGAGKAAQSEVAGRAEAKPAKPSARGTRKPAVPRG